MNILKHMEAAFIAAALVAVPASYLVGGTPDAHARVHTVGSNAQAYAAAVATKGKTAVVVVSARRLDVGEKRDILVAAR